MSSPFSTFDSFNARYISFEDVAKSFIPNDQYSDLCLNNHSLLMGPRGSGKTTLLKMLTIPSQAFYKRKIDNTTPELPFIAVYIPTDIQWKKQIEILTKDKNLSQSIREQFPRFLITNNIQVCFIKTIKHYLKFKIDDETKVLEVERDISQKLIDVWEIEKPHTPTLSDIEISLKKRLREVNIIIKRSQYEIGYNKSALPNYFYEEYFNAIISGLDTFESVVRFGPENSQKWALCFDELEIAPDWLQLELYEKLRSVDQRLIFKLTTSPIITLIDKQKNIQASEGEDFRVIRTWNFNDKSQNKWNIFSEKLLNTKISKNIGQDLKPLALFGTDDMTLNLRREFKSKVNDLYSEGSYYYQIFKSLAELDESFKQFLEKKGINPTNPIPKSTSERDQIFRKILQIAYFRYHFRSKQGKSSRKNPALFYGVPTIYELCDGNPRLLINLFDALLKEIHISNRSISVTINNQSRVIREASKRYLNLLSTHPDATLKIHDRDKLIGLGSLISQIGNYFNDSIIGKAFSMDPYSSFTVDQYVPDQILKLIELGIHLGAFIYLDPQLVMTKSKLLGAKFRLTYLLHPNFNLPKREYKSINLSNILFKGTRGKTKEYTDQLLIDLR